MTNKTRKHIWPGAVVMSIAIVGLLAAFVVLAANPGGAAAHDSDTHAADCEGMSEQEQRVHDLLNPDNPCAEGSAPETATPPPPSNDPPVATGTLSNVELHISTTSDRIDVTDAFSDPDGDMLTYSVASSNPSVADATIQDGVMIIVAGSTRGSATITVTASDGKGGSASVTVTVTVVETYTLTAEPMWPDIVPAAPAPPAADPYAGHRGAMLPPRPTDPNEPDPYAQLRALPADAIYVVLMTGRYDAKFNLAVAGSEDDVTVTITARPMPGITVTDSDGLIGAGFIEEAEGDLEGSLTVKATDAGSRAFEIEGECETPGAFALIEVDDKDLDRVSNGAVFCKPADVVIPDDTVGKADCFSVTGNPDANRDDVMRHATNPEIGQDTIQVVNTHDSVQITVTSCDEGPVWIRFLDSNMEVFGTDVDECDNPCIDAAGADVTGLASGQKLTLNLTKAWSSDDEEDLAMALMYDQYSVVTPGDGSHPYLRGIPGIFHQGKFRVHDPCDVGDFYVEVYEKNGKVRQKLDNGSYTEMVSCVAPQVPEATELTITVATASIMEDANGVVTGTVTVSGWEAVLGAVSYHVGAFDMSTPGQPTIAGYEEVPSIQPVEFEGIRSGIEYIYAVVGELADGTYSRLRYHSQANTFTLGQ